MRFGLKKLGPINEAEIEIGDLTIICGKNNTGKTYFTYSLYSFLATIQRSFIFQIKDIDDQCFNVCYKEGSCFIDAKGIWEKINNLLENYTTHFAKMLPIFLAMPSQEGYEHHAISITLEECDFYSFMNLQTSARFQVTEKCTIHIKKQAQSSKLEIRLENTGERLPRKENLRKMFDVVCSIFFNQIFADAFSLTGERSGISIFADNIADFSRKMENISFPVATLKKRIRKIPGMNVAELSFPLPVAKELAFFQKLRNLRKKSSYISREYPNLLLEADLLSGGHYDFDDQLGVQYFPKDSKNPLTLSECSSSVKSLVEFNFYLRHCAKKNQILMIDEPELNLHPINQCKLARLLAELVNAGIRIFITTHSDYIIREFNTLIQLRQGKSHIARIKAAEGYSDSQLLDFSRVRAYVANYSEEGIVFDKAPISQEDGITISTLDEVIDKMNTIQEAIIWGD